MTKDAYFHLFMLLIVLDFIFALLVAARNGKLRSRTCANGIYKSIAECIMVLGLITMNNIVNDVNFTNAIRWFLVMFITKEGISVLANLKQLGVWIPDGLVKALESELNKNNEISERK